jgi:hypothetical protein
VLDVVIAMTVLEAVLLVAYHRRTGRGLSGRDVLAPLASGMFLVLGFRLYTLGADWMWIGLCLLGAFVTHLADLIRRWV